MTSRTGSGSADDLEPADDLVSADEVDPDDDLDPDDEVESDDVGDDLASNGEEDDDGPTVSVGEVGAVPAAASIRKFTAQASRSRAGAKLGTLLGDVYYAVISFAIAGGVAVGVAQQLRVSLPPAPDVAAPQGLSLPALVVIAFLGLAGALVSLAGRLGPVSSGGAEATWWLGLPVDRRALLRPAARRVPLVAAAAGAGVVALLDGALLADDSGRVLRAAAGGMLAALVLVLGTAVAQSLGVERRHTALVGDLTLLAAPMLAVGLTVVGTQADALPLPSWPVLGAALAAVVALAVLVDRRLGRLPARTLRESGSVVGQVAGAVVSMDSRELGRALSSGTSAPVRRRVSRLRAVRGAASALVVADLVQLRRSPRHVAQLIAAALLPVLVTVVPQLAAPGGVLVAVLIGGYVAQSATGEGARYAQIAPVLDRLLPLSARTVRRLRMVTPALLMLPWSLVVFAVIGRWAGSGGGWLALGVASTPVWAAAAVRAAYRPAPDWTKPLVSTPMGALPTGVAAVISRGPDVVVLGLLPTWIALLVENVSSTVLIAQVACSLIAVLVASSIAEGTFMDWIARQQDLAEKERAAARTGRP